MKGKYTQDGLRFRRVDGPAAPSPDAETKPMAFASSNSFRRSEIFFSSRAASPSCRSSARPDITTSRPNLPSTSSRLLRATLFANLELAASRSSTKASLLAFSQGQLRPNRQPKTAVPKRHRHKKMPLLARLIPIVAHRPELQLQMQADILSWN